MMSLFLLALVFKIRISQKLEEAILFGVTFFIFFQLEIKMINRLLILAKD